MSGTRQIMNRRWFLFALAVIVLTLLAWRLGEWQFDRLEDRKERNSQIKANEEHSATDVSDVLSTERPVAQRDEWRLVSATGTYRVDDQIVVRYRTRDGVSGVDIVTPLETDSGTSVLVNRGWLETANRGGVPVDIPAPPAGEVTVTGWVRADGTGDSTNVTDQATRSINSERIGAALDLRVYRGFLNLQGETPPPEVALAQVELPELDNGPHFFYGLQWWFFGALAVFGFGYLMYDELHSGRRRKLPLSRRSTSEDESDSDRGE